VEKINITKKKIVLAFASVTLLLISATMISVRLTNPSSSTAVLSIKPPAVRYEKLVVGQRFSINITVANVTNLKSIKFQLSFNTITLDVMAITFLAEDHLPSGYFNVNDLSGTIWMNITYEGNPITTVNSVELASIKFKMMDYGKGPLHFYNTTLIDSSGNSIPYETIDGYVAIIRHDVAITAVTTSTNETYPGRLVNITATATNLGMDIESFTVTAFYNQTIIQSAQITNLTPNMSITVTFTWNTTGVAPSTSPYVIKAQASTVPYEMNTTNNIYVGKVKIKIPGDVNNDDAVDINDLIAWDKAYGTRKGDINWNPQADINGDGIVGKSDAIIIISNYHSSTP